MTEQRLIDANILSTSFGTLDWHCYNDCQNCNMKYGTCEAKLTMDDVLHNINSAPTVDAVPIVRCKDCVHRYLDEVTNEYWCDYVAGIVQEGCYCWCGKRKEGEQDDQTHDF